MCNAACESQWEHAACESQWEHKPHRDKVIFELYHSQTKRKKNKRFKIQKIHGLDI